MKEYYLIRLHWIFNYTRKAWWYYIVKTLCLIVGVPIYAVSFVMEMVLTAINMLFSWIPVLNVVVMVLCKVLITLFGSTFYICILPDIRQYRAATKREPTYEVVELELPVESTPQQDQQEPTEAENTEE